MSRIRKFWLVDCDHPNHMANWVEAGEAEGAPAAVIDGHVKLAEVASLLRKTGWKITTRKRICPACVSEDELAKPCPECGHSLGGHTGEKGYGGISCKAYNKGQYCTCTRDPQER